MASLDWGFVLGSILGVAGIVALFLIPGVRDFFLNIINVLRSGMDWIIFSAPTFFRVIFFILIFVFIFNTVFNHTLLLNKQCDSSGKLLEASYPDAAWYRLELLAAWYKEKAWKEDEYVDLQYSSTYLKQLTPLPTCGWYLDSATGYFDSGDSIEISKRYAYLDEGCISCTSSVKINNPSVFSFGLLPSFKRYCLDNIVHRKDLSDLTYFEKLRCSDSVLFSKCSPPTDYYYDSSLNKYICYGESCLEPLNDDGSVKSEDGKYLSAAEELRAKSFSKSAYDYTERDALGFKCIKDLDGKKYKSTPDVMFFGIPVFDIRTVSLVIVLMVIFAIVGYVKK
jgi:hypothetical protein